MKIENATEKEYPAITQELELLLKQFGVSPYTLSLLKIDANFSAFHLKDTEKAKNILKNAMEMPLNKYQLAEVKMD